MQRDTLDFVVRMAATQQDMRDVCAVRAAAYGHHDPGMGPRFGQPDALDQSEGMAVMLCRDKVSGQGIGTMRIQLSGFGPLLLEDSVTLPPWLAHKPRAQISRLAVRAGAPCAVKLSLMKASYQYCLAMQVRWMVIGARSAALIRSYRSLGFKDVFEDGAWVPLASGGGLPHQILALDVASAKADWQATRNRLYGFMTEVHHADLQVLEDRSTAPAGLPMAWAA